MAPKKRLAIAVAAVVLVAGAGIAILWVSSQPAPRWALIDVGLAKDARDLDVQGNATLTILDRHPIIRNETLFIENFNKTPPKPKLTVQFATAELASFAQEFGGHVDYLGGPGVGFPYVDFRYNGTLFRALVSVHEGE